MQAHDEHLDHGADIVAPPRSSADLNSPRAADEAAPGNKHHHLPVRTIEGPASWRSRMLSALIRTALREPLDPDADIAALRRHYESLDARYFAPDRSVVRETIDCDGVAAEWVSVPESRPGRTVFYLHGGSFASCASSSRAPDGGRRREPSARAAEELRAGLRRLTSAAHRRSTLAVTRHARDHTPVQRKGAARGQEQRRIVDTRHRA